MSVGFQISRLTAVSPTRPPAELQFRPGFNVLTGASDTGKSYVVECIDYMLGGGAELRRLNESTPFSDLLMEVASYEKGPLTLRRSMLGGEFELRWGALSQADGTATTIGAKHDPKNDQTVSSLLLNLSGLAGKRVQLNQRGKTRGLSFRDVVRFVLVDETEIIRRGSAVQSAQYTEQTKDQSTFRVLLTGVDYSSVVEAPEAKVERAQREGGVVVLDHLISDAEGELRSIPNLPNVLPNELRDIGEKVAVAHGRATATEAEIAGLEATRRGAWEKLKAAESRRIVIREVLARFDLLRSRYDNDLERLDALAEADYVFSQLGVEKCPFCGAVPPDAEHGFVDAQQTQAVRDACEAERAKILLLRDDLAKAVRGLKAEDSQLDVEASGLQVTIDRTLKDINERLTPARQGAGGEVRELLQRKSELERASFLEAQIADLRSRREEAAAKRKRRKAEESGKSVPASTSETAEFCHVVEDLLREWRYPGLQRVTFSETNQDLVISGKDRSSQGKGFRAIGYAAFVIGLMRYCKGRRLPHPGFVVLDSPLVTYRKPDVPQGEEIPEDVKEAFYESLSGAGDQEQIIVFENEEPSQAVRERINYVHFSGSRAIGRYGFFPT